MVRVRDSPPLIEWLDLGKEDDVRRVTFKTSTGQIAVPLQREVQRILDVARLLVEGISRLQSFSGAFADAQLQLDPANNRRLPLAELKTLARERVLQSAFRDAMEECHLLLEDVRDVLAIWSFTGVVGAGEFEARAYRDAETFHRLGLPRKLDQLRQRYGFAIRPEAEEILMSLNQLRNCIVHRGGIVGTQDCLAKNELRVVWRQHAMRAGRSPTAMLDETRPVGPGDTLTGGEYLLLGIAPREMSYPLGAKVAMTTQDLSEMLHTLCLVGRFVAQDLAKRSIELGHQQTGG